MAKHEKQGTISRTARVPLGQDEVGTETLKQEKQPGARPELGWMQLEADFATCLGLLWDSNPEIKELLAQSGSVEEARTALYEYVDRTERRIFAIDNETPRLEKANIRECSRVFRSILGPINEVRTATSALTYLWRLARGYSAQDMPEVRVGFLWEFINLFKGIAGNSGIYDESIPPQGLALGANLDARTAAQVRTTVLDEMAAEVHSYLNRYPSGLEPEVIERRRQNQERICQYFGASNSDWFDYGWQLRKVIRDAKTLSDLIELTSDDIESINLARKHKIPIGITPYYVSLMDQHPDGALDHAVRGQVIPFQEYVHKMVEHKADRESYFDFMGEADTSPVDLVTRRYPLIAILKPINTCAQICVYCQRNWEITEVLDPKAFSPIAKIQQALAWFDEHPHIGEVLVTGGDPCIMKDSQLEEILAQLATRKQLYRIRVGTRTPVVLPMRWTDELVAMCKKYHQPPQREIAIVTHFEHSYEITPDALAAVQKIRQAGMNVYNQEVFTINNSRRFESAKLRLDLKAIGIDPYYNFNMKGKEELQQYRVPVARILQERKEEARLLPGLDRTDEPVFNVPRLGKNHLRNFQDHRVVMIKPDGSRVYEFHPWEKYISRVPAFNCPDVPIYDYLMELHRRGEDISEYQTIWYYY